MANRATLLVLLQAGLLVALAMAWSTEGVRGEDDLREGAFDTVTSQGRSSFVRRQLTEGGYNGGRSSSCSHNKEICTKSPYPAGSICCSNSCIDVRTDYNHCGSCWNRCGWSQTCCSGKCVYLSKDSNNCGRCGVKCPHNECKYGVCKYNSGGYGGEHKY